MKRFIAIILMLIMVSSIAFAYSYTDLEYQVFDERGRPVLDENKQPVYELHWAVVPIEKLTRIGMIEGFPDNTFRPDETITRAEYLKMVISIATNRTFEFSNIPVSMEHWAGAYVAVAEMQGVADKGKYTQDNLDQPITRIEMVSILARIQINMKGYEQYREGKIYFKDIANVSEKEKEYLVHAIKYDLLKEIADGEELKPNQNLTRAEAVASLVAVY